MKRFALMMVVLLAAGLAHAEDEPTETVANRPRPELDPEGLRLGVWKLDGYVGLGYLMDDNIFATESDEIDDDILRIEPRLVLASDWGRHSLRLGAEATIGRYSDFDSEDYEDTRLFTDGRLDVSGGKVTGGLSYSDQHEERTSPDDIGGLEPTTFQTLDAELAWEHQPGALLIRPDVRSRSLSFDDSVAATPPNPLDRDPSCSASSTAGLDLCSNADRDRDVLSAGLRVGYDLAEQFNLFVEGRANVVDYDQAVDFDGFERSSDGYEFVTGSTFNLGGKTFGEVYAGYRSWSFDDPRFETITGPAFGADVTWNATPLITLGLGAERTIEATTIVGASGIERTAASLSVDYELLRNLLLWAKGGIASEAFEGIDRDDDLVEAGFGARYLLNRRISVSLGLETEQRDSSGAQADDEFDIQRIEFRIQGNL